MGYAITWENGRQLAEIDNWYGLGFKNEYTYNADGLRTERKYYDGDYYCNIKYTLDGDKVIKQEIERNGIEYIAYYMYDESGRPIAFAVSIDGGGYEYYFYESNIFGDITAIYDENGSVIAQYKYDAWGNYTTTYSGDIYELLFRDISLFKYRGYIYDWDTGFYYLQSRYYDPEVGRFINADGYINGNRDLLGFNMYAYCGNNPILYIDPNGEWVSLVLLVATITVAAITLTSSERQVETSGIKYDVPLYNQGLTSMCWAYCQVMVESYQNGETLSQKDADKRAKEIAIARNGVDNWNRGGYPSNMGASINVENINDLYDALNENGPLYAYYSSKKVAHLVVVTGVDVDKGIVYTNNPWGVRGEQSFSEFQSGVAKRWYEFGLGLKLEYIFLVEG